MSKELTVMPVNSLADIEKLGGHIAKSCMFGIKTPEAGAIVAMTCYQQGITLLDFMRSYHIIDGKPSMRSDAMAAEFRRKGGKIKILERSAEKAEAEFSFEKQKVTFTCTMDEIKEAGTCYGADGKTLKVNYKRHPKNMLWARMLSDAIRTLAPEINAGLYTPEEIQDIDQPRHVENEIIADPEKVKKAFQPQKPPHETPAEKATSDEMFTGKMDVFKMAEDGEFVDFSVCPIPGVCEGQAWREMDTAWLKKAIKIKVGTKGIEQGHIDLINGILAERQES